jgi:hypothetical protein
MTLDEAIEHCEEVAKSSCSACGEDHKQLAEWLKELKRRRQEDSGTLDVNDLPCDVEVTEENEQDSD